MTRINRELRRQVEALAHHCCEYCRLSRSSSLFSLHVDHIIAEKHDGPTTLDNLALSCLECNLAKGSDIASIDRVTGQLTALFNPRKQQWSDHFVLDGVHISGQDAVGRVTVRLLAMNDEERIERRIIAQRLKRYPCPVSE